MNLYLLYIIYAHPSIQNGLLVEMQEIIKDEYGVQLSRFFAVEKTINKRDSSCSDAGWRLTLLWNKKAPAITLLQILPTKLY
jgi:hypothetical protein